MQYSHWLKNWLNLNKPSVKKCTFKRYLGYARIISRYIGGRDLSEISPALLIKTAAEMSKTYAQSTVNAALSVIKRSISAAEKLGALKTHVEFPRRAFPRPRERKCLTLSDQKKLESFVELSRRPKLFGITLCLYTGLRVGELLALEWSDIDFASGTLKVGKTCRDVYENGGYKKELDSPKSFSSARTIGPQTPQKMRAEQFCYRGQERKNCARPLLPEHLLQGFKKARHTAHGHPLAPPHLCNARLGVRNGRKNAIRNFGTFQPLDNPQRLRPQPARAQARNDE